MSRPVNGSRTFGTHILSWTRTGQGTEESESLWRGKRSVRTSRRNPAGLTMGVRLLLMIFLLQKLSLAKECDDGFYKSQRGICCELCPAGTYKEIDCLADKMRAACDLCPEGSFMNRVNHEEKCAQCSSCGPDEEVAHTCSVAQDTVCQCIQGLKRDPGSGICLHENQHTAIVLGSILGLVLSAFSLFLLKTKRKWLTLKKTSEHYGTTYRKNNDEGEELAALVFIEVQGSQKSETMKLIRENQENLKAWIGVDPSHLLEHLKDYEWIPHHVYNAARKRHGEECVEHILDHFLKKGDTGCKELWEALFFVRKHYLQLWRWLHNRGDAMQCIRENKSALKLWISRDPHHLLEHLKSQTFISNGVFAKAKGMNGGEKCAELLLNYFINRGNDDCLQLLISLQAVQDEYPEVKQWLGSLGSTKTKSNGISVPRVDVLSNGIQSDTLKLIQENKGNFREWIGVDTSHFLKFFDESHSIPHEVCQAAKNKHGEECVDVILDHFFNQEETALWELWKGLYYVRRNYEPLKSWFQKHGESVRSIKEKKLDLKLWIAKDPRHLLLQLTSRVQIRNKIFTQAKGMNNGEKSAEALLNYFISRGNDDCLQLLFALQAVQDKYPEVTQWLGSLVFFKRLCKKTSLFLNTYTNYSLQEKIRSYKRELIQALHSNVIPLLSQLQSRNIFTYLNVQEAKEREQWQGSEKATEYMLELVCVKRHVKQLWMVLWNLRETYPQLKDIFEQF
ncbi:uncharacterized protein LOC142907795 isoform X2 [Petromyzon marinus]|uniref:uncharacterized protein LOC142907795 isoform X2 n=1 Tax=Petromyzon marinus TaxID=7757 RepID=UPI003F71E079